MWDSGDSQNSRAPRAPLMWLTFAGAVVLLLIGRLSFYQSLAGMTGGDPLRLVTSFWPEVVACLLLLTADKYREAIRWKLAIQFVLAIYVALLMYVVGLWLPIGLLMFLLSILAIMIVLVVLIQRGRGGGLVGALGGMGGQSAFGTKAGDTFTKITMWFVVVWIGLSAGTTRKMNEPTSIFGQGTPLPAATSAEPSGATDGNGEK